LTRGRNPPQTTPGDSTLRLNTPTRYISISANKFPTNQDQEGSQKFAREAESWYCGNPVIDGDGSVL